MTPRPFGGAWTLLNRNRIVNVHWYDGDHDQVLTAFNSATQPLLRVSVPEYDRLNVEYDWEKVPEHPTNPNAVENSPELGIRESDGAVIMHETRFRRLRNGRG